MPELKVGDRVRFVRNGREGEVIHIERWPDEIVYWVKVGKDEEWIVFHDEEGELFQRTYTRGPR